MMRFLDFARLVRLPNAFSAMADICLGALVTDSLPDRLLAFLALLLSSTCLYCGGMVWNDYFDLEQDKRERPFRPLPSGRVSPEAAARLGVVLLVLGVASAAGASWTRSESFVAAPTFLALLLAGAVLLYDG